VHAWAQSASVNIRFNCCCNRSTSAFDCHHELFTVEELTTLPRRAGCVCANYYIRREPEDSAFVVIAERRRSAFADWALARPVRAVAA
jgi:hypothetical protein